MVGRTGDASPLSPAVVTPLGAKMAMSVFVCLSVRVFENDTSNLHEVFCTC